MLHSLSIETVSLRTCEVHKRKNRVRADRRQGVIFMLASYRWIVGCTLLVGLLAGTSAYANSTEVQQQIPKRNRSKMTVLTRDSHGVGQFYFGRKSFALTDSVADRTDKMLFDIFCDAVDTEWLRPGQNISTPALQRNSKPAMSGRRYRLRPC